MEITEKNIWKNALMHRDELNIKIKFQKTPSRRELREFLAKSYNIDKDLIVIKKIFTEFGIKEAKVKVFIYENKGWFNKFEILRKKDIEKEKQKAESKEQEQERSKTEKSEEKKEKEEGKIEEKNSEKNPSENKKEEKIKENTQNAQSS